MPDITSFEDSVADNEQKNRIKTKEYIGVNLDSRKDAEQGKLLEC